MNELVDDADIGLFERALLEGADALRAAGRADNRVTGSRGLEVDVIARTVEARRVDKERELDLADLLGLRLTGLGYGYGAVRAHCDRGGIGWNRHGRLERVAIRGHDVALRIELEVSGARVAGLAVR